MCPRRFSTGRWTGSCGRENEKGALKTERVPPRISMQRVKPKPIPKRHRRLILRGIGALLLLGYAWLCLKHDIFYMPPTATLRDPSLHGIACVLMVCALGTASVTMVFSALQYYFRPEFRPRCEKLFWILVYTIAALAIAAMIAQPLFGRGKRHEPSRSNSGQEPALDQAPPGGR